eukprot:6087452-Pyramimonas_sp.AAC.1
MPDQSDAVSVGIFSSRTNQMEYCYYAARLRAPAVYGALVAGEGAGHDVHVVVKVVLSLDVHVQPPATKGFVGYVSATVASDRQ